MAERRMAERSDESFSDAPTLSTLARTLQDLETRLAGLSAARARSAFVPRAESPAPQPMPRAALSEAVSEIVMRQSVLDRGAAPNVGGPTAAEFGALSDRVQTLARDGESHAALSGVVQELKLIRDEIKADVGARLDLRFDDMRAAFADLAGMIEARASAADIAAEIAHLDTGLSAMENRGADDETIRSLRQELVAMHALVGDTARGTSLRDVERRWDAFETRFSDQAEEDKLANRNLKDELEQLRLTIGTLASGDQVKAVEKRWNDLEDRLLLAPPSGEDASLSDLLRAELAKLGEKLETMSAAGSTAALEARLSALQENFAGREIEDKIEAMASRIAELEGSLARLPESLPIAGIEKRVQSLATNVETLLLLNQSPEIDQFIALEERLDEISRAIVASTMRAPAGFDMAPVERIEARLQTLSARVDEIADEGMAEALNERLQRFGAQLEGLLAARDAATPDTAAFEARLADLAARLETGGAPRLDAEIVQTLEAQIERLSARIGEAGLSASQGDNEMDRRLAAIERRLDENRDQILEAARAAADEAVRQVLESGDRRESLHIARLSDELRSLEALSRDSDKRAGDFFETIHATLSRLVSRLDEIETDFSKAATVRNRPAGPAGTGEGTRSPDLFAPDFVTAVAARAPAFAEAGGSPAMRLAPEAPSEPARGGLRGLAERLTFRRSDKPATAATMPAEPAARTTARANESPAQLGPVDAPSMDPVDMLDTREINRPLAIGSGTPDIAALIERARAQQRARDGVEAAGAADHITAARRAALAVAAETDKLQADVRAKPDASGASLVARSRKPILLAVGAILLAMLAVPAYKLTNPVLDDQSAALVEPAETIAPGVPELPATVPAEPEAAAAPGASEEVPPAVSSAPPVSEPAAATAASAPVASAAPPMAPSEPSVAPAQSAPSAIDPPMLPVPAGGSFLATPPSAPQAMGVGEAARAASLSELPADAGSPSLRAAIAAGEPMALFEIGLRMMEGRYGEARPKAAAEWFTRAAERGFAPAQYSLGTLYEKGNGVQRDTVKARDWYLAAANKGNVRAMHNLAVLFATGVDGQSDPKQAAEWFERAAEHGMSDSQFNLGILYARGAGVKQDMSQSYRWFSIVANGGDKDAAAKRDEVKKTLDGQKVAELDASVAAFKPIVRNEAANVVDVPKDWTDPQDRNLRTASVDMTRAIRNVQAILIKLGYDPGAPDGVVGARTREAIRTFQKSTGLAVNGEVDEPLIRALLERKDS